MARLAGQYRVSPKTIGRDAKTAEAIDAIGATSPDAKRMILSGEVAIDKMALQELVFKPKEEIDEIAAAIETSAYEKVKPAVQAPNGQGKPTELFYAGIRALTSAISKLSDDFAGLPGATGESDRAEMKAALRVAVDMLEDLYIQI